MVVGNAYRAQPTESAWTVGRRGRGTPSSRERWASRKTGTSERFTDSSRSGKINTLGFRQFERSLRRTRGRKG